MLLSIEAEIRLLPSLVKARCLTGASCPSNTDRHFLSSISHTLTVLSSDAE
jgi:hypothetical protein